MTKPVPLSTLLASAQRLTSIKKRGTASEAQSWQADAWDMYDLVGEQRFLASTLAGRMAQARFYIGKIDRTGDDPTPIQDDEELTEVLNSIGGGQVGLAQIIHRLGVNLFVAGDGWIVGIPKSLLPDDLRPDGVIFEALEDLPLSDLDWRMLSVGEVSTTPTGALRLQFGSDSMIEVDPSDVYMIRVWRPHPNRWWEADSPTRSSLPVLRELVGLTMHISAQVDSRLAGAGLLIVPQSAQRAMQTDANVSGDDQDHFTEALVEAMMTPISDRSSAAALVPLVVTVPDDATDRFNYLNFAKPLDSEAREMRDEAIRRLALGQDAPPELLLGTGCVDTETEILTRHGWRTHDQVGEGTEVLTIDHETGLSEWQPVRKMNRFKVTDHPMLRMRSAQHDSLTTLDHRWPVIKTHRNLSGSPRRWTTSGEGFTQSDRIPLAAPLRDDHHLAEAKYSDDFVRLVVAYTSDGSRIRNDNIRIVKFSEPEIVEMRRIMISLHGSSGYREERHPTSTTTGQAFILRKSEAAALLELCGEHKEVPRSFVDDLTHSQRLLFLDSAVQIGDGVLSGESATTLYQVQPERLEAFEYAAILTGHKITTGVRNQQTGYGTRPLSWVRWSLARTEFDPNYVDQSEETYTGVVWCPTTDTSTWLARRGGTIFYTGNSLNHWGSWLVREEVVTTHLEPPLALICDALTTQFLWPVLDQQGMDADEINQYVIWYDVSHMIIRPNRTTDALVLHDRGLISDDSLRVATGFDSSDAPVENDPVASMALGMIVEDPSLLQDPGVPALLDQLRDLYRRGGQSSQPTAEVVDLNGPVEGDIPTTAENPAELPSPPRE